MKFLITWDIGYGRSHEVVEVDDEDAAHMAAYEAAKEEFEQNADYSCLGEATPELLEEYEGDL